MSRDLISQSKGRGFESQQRILDVMFEKDQKLIKKEAGNDPVVYSLKIKELLWIRYFVLLYLFV